ncbi:MAG: proteasome accessory factor PafA2 [Actinomycetaceae bacterium]|nr:proteasome accessory factor PafA2 [Actinomycetaceae bacterium]
MSVQRIVGLETEFAILEKGNVYANSVALSAEIVEELAASSVASPSKKPIAWDYRGEDPLNDARGYRMERASAHPSQLTDNPDQLAPSGDSPFESLERLSPDELRRPRPSNTVLANGARLYLDHAHPEYSSPEVTTPREAIAYDRAGEILMAEGVELLRQKDSRDIRVYKNNVDGKGASYGAHENYLVKRSVDFDDIIHYMTPFFVTRPLICGAGRLGIGQRSETAGFQISQRADYVENEVGLETTFDRPIINTRDEPHADSSLWRRLHVIGGDANQFDVSILLKIGTTSLLLWFLESGADRSALDTCILADPVHATHVVSHDPGLTELLEMADGSRRTALDIQRVYFEVLAEAVRERGETDSHTREVLDYWEQVLDALSSDIFLAAGQVEWVAKYQLLQSLRERGGLAWDNERLLALDLQWHDVSPERSIVAKLDAAGKIERLVSRGDVLHALLHAPETSRAYLRGGLVSAFPHNIAAAGWNGIILDIPDHDRLLRLPLTDPRGGSREHYGKALEGAETIQDFVNRLNNDDWHAEQRRDQ